MSAPTTTNSVSSSPKRSWRRFTLRALLLAVVIAGIFFGWVAYRVRQFHDQANFIADLRTRGFRIETEGVKHAWFWRFLAADAAMQVKTAILCHEIHGRFVGPTTEDMRRLSAWTEVDVIWLYGASITNETLQVVRNFRQLQSLMLFETGIGDAGLHHLVGLPDLTYLRIENKTPRNEPAFGKFTTAAADHISKLTQLLTLHLQGVTTDDNGLRLLSTTLSDLRELSLVECDITDTGLQEVTRLTHLSTLRISHNPSVTDAGLQVLSSLNGLRMVDATHTRVTMRGCNEFRKTRPSVIVAITTVPM